MKASNAAGLMQKEAVPAMAYSNAPDQSRHAEATSANKPAGSRAESRKQTLVLAEKLLARLPAEGAVLAMVSLSLTQADAGVGLPLACSLEIITAKPVLLVDLIRRRAEERESRPENDAPGVMDVLRGSATLAQALQITSRPAVKRLGLGVAGDLPVESIVSGTFRDLLGRAREQFPWVIVQCAGLLEPELSACLLSRADAALVAIKRGEGRARDLESFSELCAQLKTEFLGVVLT
jgi:Mrp family chromosome partitioning ATPase